MHRTTPKGVPFTLLTDLRANRWLGDSGSRRQAGLQLLRVPSWARTHLCPLKGGRRHTLSQGCARSSVLPPSPAPSADLSVTRHPPKEQGEKGGRDGGERTLPLLPLTSYVLIQPSPADLRAPSLRSISGELSPLLAGATSPSFGAQVESRLLGDPTQSGSVSTHLALRPRSPPKTHHAL